MYYLYSITQITNLNYLKYKKTSKKLTTITYSRIVDYTIFFKYKEITKIHGKPKINTILTVYKQLKRNAQRVPTTLGGGQLGYLALILSAMAYAAFQEQQIL